MSAQWQPRAESPTAPTSPQAASRPMGVDDLDAVMAIEARCYSHPWTRGNFIDSLAAGYLARVLEHTGELVGYVVAMPGAGEMHLLNVTVAPDWQHRGLARHLLDELDRLALAGGRTTMWLEVRAGNARARALYLRRGFEEVGVRRGYYPALLGQREDAIVMRAALPPAPAEALRAVE